MPKVTGTFVSDVPAKNRHSELVDLAWALLRGVAGDWLLPLCVGGTP